MQEAFEVAIRNYRPQAFDGDIVYLEAHRPRNRRSAARWAQLVRGKFEIVRVPGTHASVFWGPDYRIAAQVIIQRLNGVARLT